MPTPSIQTLTTDAQQILNLDSISAVRSVVAVALANANTGTPLNPNLTTQQLWDQFYQVVTRPKSDIESIIANQLMKFLYAPPAPGGAGADKQVIFNDGGVLAGDADFLWNKTTNLLTVTGSATITGDLTVDTSTLKVDSANDRVGIGTASPAAPLDVQSNTSGTGIIIRGRADNTNALRLYANDGTTQQGYIGADNSNIDFLSTGGRPLRFFSNNLLQYQINPLGVFTWYDGAGGTRMTLNSTGLGVGITSPSYRLEVRDTADAVIALVKTGANSLRFLSTSSGGVINQVDNNPLAFYTNNTERARIDSSGNFGLGVTPSAWNWAGIKALEIGYVGNGFLSWASSETYLLSNTYYNTGFKYGTAVGASYYKQLQGVHSWHTNSNSPSAGGSATFTQAMTLDASGNLLVGDTAQSSNERLRVNNTASNGWAVTMTSTTRGWLNRQSDANGGIAAYFEVGSGNTNVGSINTTSSGTSFVTTSDYRLKEAVQPLVGGLARISALKPSIYKWKVDGSSGEGFLAHELAEVVPAAVTGEKDAVNDDGSIKAQGVDLSKVVPVLVAAIQELTARVQTLETR